CCHHSGRRQQLAVPEAVCCFCDCRHRHYCRCCACGCGGARCRTLVPGDCHPCPDGYLCPGAHCGAYHGFLGRPDPVLVCHCVRNGFADWSDYFALGVRPCCDQCGHDFGFHVGCGCLDVPWILLLLPLPHFSYRPAVHRRRQQGQPANLCRRVR